MAFWLYRPDQYRQNTPLLEISEHAAKHGFNDRPMQVVCLHGIEFIPAEDRRLLKERNFHLHDASGIYRAVASRYPNLAQRHRNHYFECFLRWIVLDEFCRGSAFLAWDADIFLNVPLGRIEEAYEGSTFTVSSTCFAAIGDQTWLKVYRKQLDLLERDPVARLREIFARLGEILARSPAHFEDSFFGPKIVDTMRSFEEWLRFFDSTPEEMLVDYMTRDGLLPVEVKPGATAFLLSAQPLILPRQAWHHPLAAAQQMALPSDARWELSRGTYSYGGCPLAFVHFQGALFRACTVRNLFHHFLNDPGAVHDELYSPPERRHGRAVSETFFRQKRLLDARLACRPDLAGLRAKWGDPFSERDVARNVFLKENLLGFFGDFERAPATPPPAVTETPEELREFISKLGTFFESAELMQLEWMDASTVSWVTHSVAFKATAGPGLSYSGFHPRLPLADTAVDTVFNLGSLAQVSESELPGWLAELERVTARNLWLALPLHPNRDRGWWETRLFAAGFRKHPLAHCILGYEELNVESDTLLIICEKIPSPARIAYPLAKFRQERNLPVDMLRETGIQADGQLARYILAREHVRAGVVVLDAMCGLGYGSAVLASGTGAARVIGVEVSAEAVDYARENFSRTRPNLEFHAQEAPHLVQLPDASVDLVVSFDTLERMPNPERLLQEFRRVLRPGGTLVSSVPNLWLDEQGRNPVPSHLHVYDLEQFLAQMDRYFEWRSLYRQNAGGAWKRPQARLLRSISALSPSEAECRDAEWWVGVAVKAASV